MECFSSEENEEEKKEEIKDREVAKLLIGESFYDIWRIDPKYLRPIFLPASREKDMMMEQESPEKKDEI